MLLKDGGASPRPTRHRGVFLVWPCFEPLHLNPKSCSPYKQVVEPEVLKLSLDELVAIHNIDVLLHTPVVSAQRSSSGKIEAVIIQDGNGRRTLFASAFVDCSGDCDLAFYGGASTRYGNGSGPVNLGSLSTRFGGLSNAKPTAELWKSAILAAKDENPSLKLSIPKNVSVLLRLPQSRDIVTYLASASFDARDSNSHTIAEQHGRRQAQTYLNILRGIPGHESMYLVSTGPNFGTRESRHINAHYQLSREDVLEDKHFEDVIAIGGWGLEWHDATAKDWSSTFHIPDKGCFEIPLRSLHSIDTSNLFVAGRCMDGDRDAGSAARVLGTAVATGQAAGVAAALLAMNGTMPPAQNVQSILIANGALLDTGSVPPAGVIDPPDNS